MTLIEYYSVKGKLLEHFVNQLKQRTYSEKVRSSQMMEESAFNVDLLPTFQPSYEYAGRISDVPYLVRAFGDQLCIRNNETHMPG